MAQYWKYVGNVVTVQTIPQAVKDEWEETLGAEVGRINTALTTKIDDESAFHDIISTPSSLAFDAFLSAVGGKWDITAIKLKQKVKLAASYDAWLAGIGTVFGGQSPTFAATVTAKKDNLDSLWRVLNVVGHKSLGTWEPVSMAVLLARGDTRCAQYFDTNDTFTGTLESVFDARKGALISGALIAEMVYACVMAKYADEAGLTTERGNIITAANIVIDELVVFALDATHGGGGYDFTIVISWNAGTSNVIITATDTHP